MYNDPQEGDLLMDAPKATSWHKLRKQAADRDAWRDRVRSIRQPRPAQPAMKAITRMTLRNEARQPSTTTSAYRTRDAKAALMYPKLKPMNPI